MLCPFGVLVPMNHTPQKRILSARGQPKLHPYGFSSRNVSPCHHFHDFGDTLPMLIITPHLICPQLIQTSHRSWPWPSSAAPDPKGSAPAWSREGKRSHQERTWLRDESCTRAACSPSHRCVSLSCKRQTSSLIAFFLFPPARPRRIPKSQLLPAKDMCTCRAAGANILSRAKHNKRAKEPSLHRDQLTKTAVFHPNSIKLSWVIAPFPFPPQRIK